MGNIVSDLKKYFVLRKNSKYLKKVFSNNSTYNRNRKKELITLFINSNLVFDKESYIPSFIKSDVECIRAAILRDINSIDYLDDYTIRSLPNELMELITKIASSGKYVLNKRSSQFFKSKYDIALASIKRNVYSADYVCWEDLSEEECSSLIVEVINNGYCLNENSYRFLRGNNDIVYASIIKKTSTIEYARSADDRIIEYLMSKNYRIDKDLLDVMSLNAFARKDLLKYAFNNYHYFDAQNEDYVRALKRYVYDPKVKYTYNNRIIDLISEGIISKPDIRTIKNIFQAFAENDWDSHKRDHMDLYANLFGKINSELTSNVDFNNALSKLIFLPLMKDVLGNKYNSLVEAMKEYHAISHGNKEGVIDNSRDKISSLSALFVSLSKEKYKEDVIKSSIMSLSGFFIPKKDHIIVYKKLQENKIKENICKLYINKDPEIMTFIEELINKYSNSVDVNVLKNMVNNFLSRGRSNLDSFIKAPHGWNNYKKFKEASKLINRLNSNYIKYTDKDVERYKDVIKYNETNGKFYYSSGYTFDETQIKSYDSYANLLIVFDKLKKEIMIKAKSLDVDCSFERKDLYSISNDLPFTDEFFEFDDAAYNHFMAYHLRISNLLYAFDFVINPDSILNKDSFETLKSYICNNGLIWLMIMMHGANVFENKKDFIVNSYDTIGKMKELSDMLHCDLNKFDNVLLLGELSKWADNRSIAILGPEVIQKLCRYRTFTSSEISEIIKMASDLLCNMVRRDTSTIPYVSGQTNNYKYSIYDSQDETLLLAGINTNACFRVDGNDNDFLHYCALNKNGFVIKITDLYGNFVGRSAGIRYGNMIFLNQLRTIYDQGGHGYNGRCENERAEIIATLEKACEDIVNTSQNNTLENNKIDYVIITKSYALSDYQNSLFNVERYDMPRDPMNMNYKDWEDFVKNTPNLKESSLANGFTTDYRTGYCYICLAASKKPRHGELDDSAIKEFDPEDIYERKRNEIVATYNPSPELIFKINRMIAIESRYNHSKFEPLSASSGTLYLVGDNWFITYLNGKIIDSIAFNFDKKAVVEYDTAMEVLKTYKVDDTTIPCQVREANIIGNVKKRIYEP